MNLLKVKDDAVKKFNNELTYILNAVIIKSKDELLIEIRDKYSIARRETPESILQSAGPYIWAYRKEIENSEIESFLDNSFEKEINELKNKKSNETDRFIPLIDKLKKLWKTFEKQEQDVIFKKFQLMLSIYASYLAACKHT